MQSNRKHGGRPRISDDARRNVHIGVYLTRSDAETLDRLCEQLGGCSRSDALREALHAATGVAVRIEVQP